MRLRGPCRVAVQREGEDWVSRLAQSGVVHALQARLPDGAIETQSVEGQWDVKLAVCGRADCPLAPVAGQGVPADVLRKRSEMARIVGWLPSDNDRRPTIAAAGVGNVWLESLAAGTAVPNLHLIRLDEGGPPTDSDPLPAWASDSDRAAACASSDLVIIGPEHFGASAFARGPVILCGRTDQFPQGIPETLIAPTPSNLPGLAMQALSGDLLPFPGSFDLEDRLDELATSAAEAAFARAPEAYRRWAADKSDFAEATAADLREMQDRRREDRAQLGEISHRLTYVEEQYAHCDYARLQTEEELARLHRFRAVRWANRLARLIRT